MPISGNPFYPEVIDPCQVRVGCLPQGILGKPFTFDGELPSVLIAHLFQVGYPSLMLAVEIHAPLKMDLHVPGSVNELLNLNWL